MIGQANGTVPGAGSSSPRSARCNPPQPRVELLHRLCPLVALCGYSRAGKDTAAAGLLPLGYVRYNFGDVIKRQLDDCVREHFGFSAFTEDDSQKKTIRRTLEMWGEDNYENILAEYLRNLPPVCVNTKIVRTREAEAWKLRGGIIIEVFRPELEPATDWERDRLKELHRADLVDHLIENDCTPAELQHRLVSAVRYQSSKRQAAGATRIAVDRQDAATTPADAVSARAEAQADSHLDDAMRWAVSGLGEPVSEGRFAAKVNRELAQERCANQAAAAIQYLPGPAVQPVPAEVMAFVDGLLTLAEGEALDREIEDCAAEIARFSCRMERLQQIRTDRDCQLIQEGGSL